MAPNLLFKKYLWLPHTPEGPPSLRMSLVHGDLLPWLQLVSQGKPIGGQRRLDEGDEGRECDGECSRERNDMRIFELSWGSMACGRMMIVIHKCRV